MEPPNLGSADQGPLNGGGFKRGGFPIWTCPSFSVLFGSKQKGPAEQVAPRASSLKICRFRVCVSPITPWRKYDSQRPLFGGDFLGQILAADSLPGAFVHSRSFLSFLGLSQFFWDFPELLGDGPGIFPICPFPLSRPIKSTYEEQSRIQRVHDTIWTFPEKSGKRGGWKPPGLASLNRRGSPRFVSISPFSSDMFRSLIFRSLVF